MSESLTCPRTNEACKNPTLCSDVNVSLDAVIPDIRRRVGGVSWKLAQWALTHELNTQADLLSTNFSPVFDNEGNCRICPADITEGDFSEKYGPRMAVDAVTTIIKTAITNTVNDLAPRGRNL